MHLPKVVAIYGPSRVGKTRLATELGRRVDLSVRHCGEEVRARAAKLGLGPGVLPLAEHRAIDAETRRFALEQGGIIEGRYLDLALFGIDGVVFVRLRSTEAARVVRSESGLSEDERITRLHTADEHDEDLRRELYKGVIAAVGDLTVDTTDQGPEELAARILDELGRRASD